MRLGVCYMGSKNAIAKEIVGVLPKARHFVDLFSGGCAVTHAAMLSGKYKRFIVNDINPVGQRVFFASIRGEARKHTGWVSREDFDAKVSTDPFVALCWSFGNNPKKGYCYAHEQEPLKRALHEYVVHGMTEGLERYGVAKDEIDGIAEEARYPLVKELVGTRLRKRIELESLERVKALERLESLERVKALERLESLERVKALERSELFEGDYRNVAIPDDSCVYCDIPYQSTEKYADKNGGGVLI